MNPLRHLLRAIIAAVLCCAPLAAAEPIHFQQQIAPILVRRCLACHGEQKFKGEYQLHTVQALFKPGASGETAIAPGKPATSYLLQLVKAANADQRMPKNADKLPEAEIALLERWITEGAKIDGAAADAALVNLAQWQHPQPPEVYRRPFPVTALAFAPSGKELAVGGHHEVTIWNAEDGKLLRRLKGLAERTYALAFTKDGERLIVAAGTPAQLGEVKMLQAADGSLVRHFGSFADSSLAIALSPNEQQLAVAGADNVVRIYDVATGKQERLLKDHSDWVMSLAWSAEGTRLATASRDKTCKVFDVQTGELVTTFADHGEPVFCITYHRDGKHAISAGGDGRIRYWIADDPGWENAEKMDKKKRHQVGEIGGLNSPVQRLAAGENWLFACLTDKSVRQFDLEKRNSLGTFPGHSEALFAADFHPGSKRLATAGLDGEVRIWQTEIKSDKPMPVITFVAAPGYQPAVVTAPNPTP